MMAPLMKWAHPLEERLIRPPLFAAKPFSFKVVEHVPNFKEASNTRIFLQREVGKVSLSWIQMTSSKSFPSGHVHVETDLAEEKSLGENWITNFPRIATMPMRGILGILRAVYSDYSVNSSSPPQHWCSDQWWWWCANAPRGGVLFGRSGALPPTFGKRAISCIIIRPFHTCCACTQDCACSLSFT